MNKHIISIHGMATGLLLYDKHLRDLQYKDMIYIKLYVHSLLILYLMYY